MNTISTVSEITDINERPKESKIISEVSSGKSILALMLKYMRRFNLDIILLELFIGNANRLQIYFFRQQRRKNTYNIYCNAQKQDGPRGSCLPSNMITTIIDNQC